MVLAMCIMLTKVLDLEANVSKMDVNKYVVNVILKFYS